MSEVIPYKNLSDQPENVLLQVLIERLCCIAAESGSGVTVVNSEDFSPLFTVEVDDSTTTPTFVFSAISQNANLMYASPDLASGIPTFRSMKPSDIATISGDVAGKRYFASYVGNVDNLGWRLLKKADFDDLDATQILFGKEDGSGQVDQSALFTFTVSTARLFVNGREGVGVVPADARLQVKGESSGSGTTALLVEDSGGGDRFWVRDDGVTIIRPFDDFRYVFSGSTISFTTDAGIVRDQILAAQKFTFDRAFLRNSNATLQPVTTVNYYADFVVGSTDAFNPGDEPMVVWAIRPTWNIANVTSNGDVVGYLYEPTVTALAGGNRHYAAKFTAGDMVLGAATSDPSAKLQIDSTTQGVLFPRMTTTERDAIASPVAGLVIYNTTLNKLNVYTTTWETVTSI